LAAAGCQTPGAATDGAGFARLTPSAATRDLIIRDDRAFAEQVAAHNRACERAPACLK
jgi:hypothetical protein